MTAQKIFFGIFLAGLPLMLMPNPTVGHLMAGLGFLAALICEIAKD